LDLRETRSGSKLFLKAQDAVAQTHASILRLDKTFMTGNTCAKLGIIEICPGGGFRH